MHKLITRVAVGGLLALIALMPMVPTIGQTAQLPSICEQLAFSTEEDFVTQGPEPPDGNPILSDGDLLGLGTDASGAIRCLLCARNADLLANTFDVSVDLGLDAADILDAEAFLIAFSTELDSPNAGQFTAGDLLLTNGTILPNQALTAQWQAGYDLGLDAVHFVGKAEGLKAFLDAAKEHPRGDWIEDLGLLARLLARYEVDIWFSTEGTLGPVEKPVFLDGDLLSAATGTIVAGNNVLLPAAVPAGIPTRGVDFGLDAVTTDRAGTKPLIHYSTEILYDGEFSFTDGDVLRLGDGITALHPDLIKCFAPRASFLGLDALHSSIQVRVYHAYLPVVLKDHR